MIDLLHFSSRLSNACGTDQLPTVRLSPNEIAVSLSPHDLLPVVHTLQHEFDAAFVDLFGLDQRSSKGNLQLHLLFALDEKQSWVHVQVDLDEQTPTFPSLVDALPAADWYEREVWEELGITPLEHPLLRPLRLPPDWPQGVYPHLQAFNWSQEVPAVEPRYFKLEAAPAGIVDYPLGPVRSGVVESGHYTLRTAGEEIVDMHLQLFYKHRGVEKRAEGLPVELLPLVAERISGTSAFAHSLALCQAMEGLAEVELLPRALYLRTLWPNWNASTITWDIKPISARRQV